MLRSLCIDAEGRSRCGGPSRLHRWWGRSLLMVLLIACPACHPAPEPSPRPTVGTPQAAVSPEPTPRPTVTTPEATVVPVPTPTAALAITVRELVMGEESDILAEVTVNREMPRDEFNRLNPNCRLLTPEGSLIQSSFALAGKKDQQFYASGNLNLPQYPADRVYSQPYFNQKDSVFVMRWEDAAGHQVYHCPLREDQTGRPLAVYQRNNELYEAFVGADGRIEAKSERPFWQAVPSEAKNIALVKFDRAVYLTFWRADGQQIEPARIKVSSLPEAIPTPEPKEAILKVGAVNLINQSTRCEMRYRNEDSREKVRQFMEIAWAKKLGITPAELRQRLAKGEKVTDVVVYPIILPDGSDKLVAGTVDLSQQVDFVNWDKPNGFGRSSARLNFDVTKDGKMTIFAYVDDKMVDDYPINNLAQLVLLIEAMGIVNNYGRDIQKDPTAVFPECMELFVDMGGKEYIGEILGFKI